MKLELDIPAGRHDGMVQGKRYFKCQPSHGLFVPIKDALALLSKRISGDVVAVANRLSSIRALRSSYQKLPALSPSMAPGNFSATQMTPVPEVRRSFPEETGRHSPNYSDITDVLTRRTVINSPFESYDFNKQI